ncbi:hypothetical protein IFM89_004114 [Coptis chinensis]|uniref:Uncharacterized protein n=1 Tax=Coptis chinensis TaxID=261450 RepID=A0A835LL87_9MAGN|nr:hypothetical protein IFM89_004114 [Coptis chinensis]
MRQNLRSSPIYIIGKLFVIRQLTPEVEARNLLSKHRQFGDVRGGTSARGSFRGGSATKGGTSSRGGLTVSMGASNRGDSTGRVVSYEKDPINVLAVGTQEMNTLDHSPILIRRLGITDVELRGDNIRAVVNALAEPEYQT